MRPAGMVCMAVLLTACAGTRVEQDTAIRDFITVSSLAEADRIETTSRDRHELLSDRFLVYKTRRGNYLVEFNRPCTEIRDWRVSPDIRWDPRFIRPRADTLYGCQIERIYALSEDQYLELANLGEAPGERL